MDVGENYTSKKEETEYSGDTQGLAKKRKEIGHLPSEDELSPIAQSSSPKRPKKLEEKRHVEKPQERNRIRTRTTFPKAV
jgi:hypothetical protein